MAIYNDNVDRLRIVADELYEGLRECRLCPRECGVDRLKGEVGFCRSIDVVKVSSYGPHFGEEPPLVGRYGSGTIFFTNCNLGCVFCQNYDISHLGYGEFVELEDLADMMIYLKRKGCHNINLVTPTHYLPQILKALYIAVRKGLDIPIVYNTGGFDSPRVIEKLAGLIDIYMPDIKFFDTKASQKYLSSSEYPDIVKRVTKIMYEQVGDLVIEDGIAMRGLLVRHLVMPGFVEDSKRILEFVANEISKNTYVNIMFQYFPHYRAKEYPEIARRPKLEEYLEVVNYAKKLGLTRILTY